ncbi:hypothetical protein BX600DRAFT_440698 [Xylariales sp. PMI_506]|nr:hypothetical protein BX600DRAFT_440698 [Xylariales sp. PMI_506]
MSSVAETQEKEQQVLSTTDLPSGDPIPTGGVAPPSKPPPPLPIAQLLSAVPANVDAFLAHLQRCLSTPGGVDSVLLFLCYSARFSSAFLELLTRPALRRSSKKLLAFAAALPPSTTVFFTSTSRVLFPSTSTAVLLLASKRLKALSGLISDVRTFSRLWGLLGMYFWGRGIFLRLREAALARKQAAAAGGNADVATTGPSINKVELSFSITQLIALVGYQALENGAYLSSKGVLGWQPETMKRATLLSTRLWGSYIAIKLVELFWESHKRSQRTPAERLAGGKTVSEIETEERQWTEDWRKLVVRNMAWFPLTIHWSLEQGIFSDLAVGAIASIPGVMSIRDIWKKTAAE